MNDFPGNWWIRFRIRSQADKWEEHMLYTGSNRNTWDTVEVYVPQVGGRG